LNSYRPFGSGIIKSFTKETKKKTGLLLKKTKITFTEPPSGSY
jgi:hypothetical protein